MARMLDFQYTQFKRPITRPDGTVVLGVVIFNMRGDRGNVHDDFKDALADLKNEITWRDRDWNDMDRL